MIGKRESRLLSFFSFCSVAGKYGAMRAAIDYSIFASYRLGQGFNLNVQD
jgi:hypothetical protein